MKKLKKLRSYSDYSLESLQSVCGIDNLSEDLALFGIAISPSDWLKTSLENSKLIPLNSEKAKSEWLIAPVLMELSVRNPQKFRIFSGNTFNVDAEKALQGRCDFLLAHHLSLHISAPVFAIFEAKDDSLDKWYGQCGAEMYAAHLFNTQKNEPYEIIHGAVTNGQDWQFLRLENNLLKIDRQIYSLANLPMLLGALQKLIDFYEVP